MIYYWIKTLHISTVIFTVSFFSLRLIWMISRSGLVNRGWVRKLSQFNDTLLLIAGISLALLSHQYPFVAPWLTAKLIALLAYIILGMYALKWAKSRRSRTYFGIMALTCVGYMVLVALTRNPQPWQYLLQSIL
ncbi:MAG: SirB2 family protein [Sedimenticola sp.]|nr:SirB2 family protein [Sedimenticola sp.]